MAAVTWASSYGPAKVSTGWRSSGGVAMVLISRMPVIAISRVRGIGVADMARTSTWVRRRFSCSLCSTPKRCSSSITTRPKSLKLTSPDSDPPVGETFDGCPCLSLGSEPAERCDVDGKARITIGEGGVVLLHQQSRGNQNGHLLAVLHCLECGAYRNLGFAVADISAD